MTWTRIPDESCQQVWQNPDTSEEVWVTPDWYEQNGTPIAPETGNDFEYLYTVINKDLIP